MRTPAQAEGQTIAKLSDILPKSIEIHARVEDFEVAESFIDDLLDRNVITEGAATQTMLVFEALFNELPEQGYDESTLIKIAGSHELGNLVIKMTFEGKPFMPPDKATDSPEELIIEALGDKLDYSYSSGYNTIRITVKRSYRRLYLLNGLSILCALAVYALLYFLTDVEWQQGLVNDYLFPLENLFANAMLMIGAPVTFFSLLKNLTDADLVFERSQSAGALRIRTIITSVIAIVLALGASLLLSMLIHFSQESVEELAPRIIEWSFAEIVTSLVPSNIFEPFVAASPLPAVIIVTLCAFAMRSTVKYFDALKTAIDAIYSLLCSMLRIVMTALPVFSFVTFLTFLLDGGIALFFAFIVFFVLIVVSWTSLVLTYAIRLRARGIPVIAFAKKLPPLITENLKIGSVIDAVPFNVRYCSRHYGMNRNRIKNSLQISAQLNLDGNCYLIMMASLLLISFAGIDLSWVDIVGIGTLVFFLSLGAPNQPGSILIGILIMLQFANAFDMLGMAIAAEVFLGGIQNITNVIGDIVLAAIDNHVYEQSRR